MNHFLKYLLSDFIIKILGFLTLPIYTYYLSPTEYGSYSLFISYASIAMIIFTLNTYSSVGRFLYEKDSNIQMFLFTTIILSIISLSAFSIGLYFLDTQFLYSLSGINFSTLGIPFVSLILFNTFFSIFTQILIAEKRSKEYSFLLVSKAYLTFLLSLILLAYFKHSAISIIYATVITACFYFFYIIYKLKDRIVARIEPHAIQYILHYSIFLIPYALSGVILAQIDRVMLSNILSNHEVGIYSIACTIGFIPMMLYAPISNAWIPNYFKYMDENNTLKIDIDVKNILLIISISVLSIIIFADTIVYLLLNEKYSATKSVIPLISISSFFSVLWYLWGLNIGYAKKTGWGSLIGILSAVLNIALNYFLIPLYGIIGAAYATIFAYSFMAFSGYYLSITILKIHATSIKTLYLPFSIILFSIFFLVISNFIFLLIAKIIFIVILCYLCIKNKKHIKQYLFPGSQRAV